MAISSEAKFSEAYKELRFDAEYFKPEFIETGKNLERINASQLESVVKISKLREDPTKEPNKEFVYIDISNVDTTTGKILIQRIQGYNAPSRARKLLHSNDIIISTVRPNRNAVAIIPNELDNSICSTGFCILTATKINPYYLFAFLKTKYAINQLVRKTMASMYPAVSEEDVSNILVPLPPTPFQLKIEKLVKEAFSKRNLADHKYEQAKQLLYKELGIEKLELRQDKTFEAKFSELEETMRFDSEYYQPKYENIIELLENSGFEVKRLEDVVDISNKKVDPTREPSKRFKYVELANVDPSTGEIEGYEEVIGYDAPSRARMLIKGGDVLVSSLSGSLDNVALVPEELDSSVASTGFFVINSNSLRSEFLFLLFKTELIKNQLEQKTAGAIMAAVPKTTFGDILVPLIPKPKQEEISNLIKESFTLRRESKARLDQAKKELEELIERT